MARRSEFEVSCNLYREHWLHVSVYDKSQFPTITAKLLQVTNSEIMMDGGRFKNFQDQPQRYEFVWNHSDIGGARGLQEYLIDKIDWIGSAVQSKWSFYIHFLNVSSCEIKWSFENRFDAMRFLIAS